MIEKQEKDREQKEKEAEELRRKIDEEKKYHSPMIIALS